jgi:predicted MFS family arabinose efflux permease
MNSVPREQRKLAFPVLIALTLLLGANVSFLVPVQITALIQSLKLSRSQAGMVASAEMIAAALAGFITAVVVTEKNARGICALATLATVCMDAMCLLTVPLWTFVALRLATGSCCGLIYGICCFWCARHPNGVRAFGTGLIVSSLLVAVAMAFLPALTETRGLRGFYGPVASFALIVLTAVALIRVAPTQGRPTDAASTAQRSSRFPSWVLPVILVVIALANGAAIMLWSFADEIAQARGYSVSTISVVLTAASVAAIIGSMVPATLGDRFGMSLPLSLGAGIAAVAAAGVVISKNSTMYAVALCIFQAMDFLMIPFQIGLGAAYDPSGRTGSVAGSVSILACAVSPTIGGLIFDAYSPSAVGWGSVLAFGLAALGALSLRGRSI